jgi:Ca2+-binding EF-hand superfamily protein/tRNA A-37 threonylcarbamoyl transferase component Bud32
MGNQYDKFLKDPEFGKVKDKFSRTEIFMIYKMYLDLSSRDDGIINKETFLLFFHLTGLWGERLFAKFDRKKTGRIDFMEFLQGLAICCKCDDETKVKFLFEMYDLDEDGFIEKKEMCMMLYNYPKNYIKNITEEGAPDKGEKLQGLKDGQYESISGTEGYEMPKSNRSQNLSNANSVVDLTSTNRAWDVNLDDIPTESHGIDNIAIERDIKKNQVYHLSVKNGGGVNYTAPDRIGNGPKQSIDMNGHQMDSLGYLKSPKMTASPTPSTRALAGMGLPNGSRYMQKNPSIAPEEKKIESSIRNNPLIKRGREESLLLATSVNNRVKEYASFLFKTYEGANARGKISYDEFKDWLKNHPIILKIFNESFHQELWASVEASKNKVTPPLRYTTKKPEIQGVLFKKGKVSKMWKARYFQLVDHFLFYFESKTDRNLPKKVFFLDGVSIESTKDVKSTGKYGFRISFKTDSYENHVLYCSTEKEYKDWMSFLQCFRNSSVYEKYEFKDKIGTGKFSVVHSCRGKVDEKEYAIKLIDKTSLKQEEKEFILMETSIMKFLDHPHVIKLHDTIETRTHYYIVTELVKDGDLFDYIVNNEFLEEIEASLVIKQLINTFIYLHNAGIIHRDIKPENVMISLGTDGHIQEIKIIDFGFAKLIQPGQTLRETCGTPNYVAPEVLSGKGYDKKADIWSIGIIMYLMLRGVLPFDANDVKTILQNTEKGEIDLNDEHWANVSPEAKDLVERFLKKDPKERIDLQVAHEHPWIKQREGLAYYMGKNKKMNNYPEEEIKQK